jgi:enterochelin esterase-like enzyme
MRPKLRQLTVLVRLAALALAVSSAVACTTTPQRLFYDSIALPETERVLEYAVYTPPGFRAEEELPLVVFLHGAGDGPDCFDEAGVGDHLDAQIATGEVPRAVIVIPRGDLGFWENWVDGSYRYRDWVVRSLMPEMSQRYGTAACPEGCHLIGISMGGHGALRFALLEPGLFSSVTAISAPILDTEAAWQLTNESWLRFLIPTERIWGPGDRENIARDDPFLRWTDSQDLAGMQLMLAWGDADHAQIVDTNERFDRHLRERNIPHETLVFSGRHEWRAWTPALDRVLAIQVADRPTAGQRKAGQRK